MNFMRNWIKLPFLFLLFPFFILSISSFPAYSANNESQDQKYFYIDQTFIEQVQNSDCPDVIKNYISNLRGKNVSITFAGKVVIDQMGERTIDLSCLGPNAIESIVIRLTSFIYIILGIITAFGIGKSTILIMTSSDNAEQKEKGWKGIINSVLYILLGIFSYFIITFIIVGVFGLGNNGRPEQNILCQQQIVFDITFGDGIGSCQ